MPRYYNRSKTLWILVYCIDIIFFKRKVSEMMRRMSRTMEHSEFVDSLEKLLPLHCEVRYLLCFKVDVPTERETLPPSGARL